MHHVTFEWFLSEAKGLRSKYFSHTLVQSLARLSGKKRERGGREVNEDNDDKRVLCVIIHL